MENSKKLSFKAVVALCFLVYFFSYAMRLDYTAALVSIVSDLKISNTMASAAVTGSFITYGAAQIAFGFVGDKVSPVKIISLAMLGTIIVNFLVSFCSNIWVITVLWCINGVCQAMIWPPLTRFIAEQVGIAQYANAATLIGLSGSSGTIFVYLFVPLVLEYTVWRNVFRIMSVLGVVMMLIWIISTRGVKIGQSEKAFANTEDKKTISVFGLIALAGLVPIFITIALQGILRDGIQTWLPSLVNAEFKLSESSSVLSTAILPVFSMICSIIANAINNKIRNELITATIMYSFAFLVTIPVAVGVKNPVVTIVCAALISASMHGINHMLIVLTPKNFYKYGMVSTFSGILNSCTYIGAAASGYGFAFVSDNFGWNAVLISWCVIALVGASICLFKIKSWTNFIKK